MKLNRLFYFFTFLIAFSSISEAMNDLNKDENPLEGLQKIVRDAFPPLVYNVGDLSNDLNQVFRNAQKFRQAGSVICMLPDEAITHILHGMDTQTLLLRLGTTCHYFYKATQVSGLYLNDYCSQEAMPHAMPLEILVRKTKNTKDGVFKLANLYCVSEHDLCNWFKQAYLEDILAQKEALPETLQGQSEEQLEALYPLLKITMAATPLGTDNHVRLAAIDQLFNEQLQHEYVRSFNTLRLLSLCRDAPRRHNESLLLLCLHLLPKSRGQKRLPNSNYQAFDIVARDFLMAGQRVTTVNNCYFMTNPHKKDVATQIIQWCCDHQWDFLSSDVMLTNAGRLNKPELAFQILLKIIALPNDQILGPHQEPNSVINTKINVFLRYASDERVKEPIAEFAQELLAQHQTDPSNYTKKSILMLLLETGTLKDDEMFRRALAEILDDPIGSAMHVWHVNEFFVEGLFKHGFEEEGKSIIQYTLIHTPEHFTPIYGLESLIDCVLKIDQEDFISQLKFKLKADLAVPKAYSTDNLDLLLGLARIEKEEAEKINLMHQSTLLYKEWKGDGWKGDDEIGNEDELQFATLYFYLNQEALCREHYHRYVNGLLGQTEAFHPEILDGLREMGLELNSIEDLKTRDPFETIQLILQAKKNKK